MGEPAKKEGEYDLMKYLVVAAYILGFAAFGLLTGLLTGLSASPVVTTIMPLLFAFVGGGIGYYINKVDLESKNIWNSLMLGSCLLAFSVTCISGTLSGISLREGRAVFSWLSMFKHREFVDIVVSSPRTPTEKIKVFFLRTHMRSLGMKESEINKMVEISVSNSDSLSEQLALFNEKDVIPAEDMEPVHDWGLYLAKHPNALQHLVALDNIYKELRLQEKLETESTAKQD